MDLHLHRVHFLVLLCISVVSSPYVIYYPTVMARYSLFLLKYESAVKPQADKQTAEVEPRLAGRQSITFTTEPWLLLN